MVKHGSEAIGSGITAGSVNYRELDPNDDKDAREFVEWHAKLQKSFSQRWAYKAHVIEICRLRWEAIKAELVKLKRYGPEYKERLKERAGEAWYVREIVDTATIVEAAVENGRPWEAVARAIEIGELITELRLKFEWDDDATWGRKQLTALRDAAQARRRSSASDRLADVDREVATGTKLTAAFAVVAERRGESESTIRNEYYRTKRSSSVG